MTLQADDVVERHDDEEPDERAKRLIFDRLKSLMHEERRLRKRVRLHGRDLNEHDRSYLAKFLARNRELTIGLIEDIGDDLPEFVWPTDADWKVD